MNSFTKPQTVKVIFDNYIDLSSVKKSFLIKPSFDINASNKCLSDYLCHNNSFDKLKNLQQSLILFPNNKEAVKQYAFWLQKHGHYNEALDNYRKWKRLAGINNKGIHNNERIINLNNVVKTSDKRIIAFSNEGDCYLRLPYKPVTLSKIIKNSRNSIFTKIAGFIIAFWLWTADSHAQSYVTPVTEREKLVSQKQLKSTYYGVPDIDWQDQQKHPDIHYDYFGKNKLDYFGSGDVNDDGVVDGADAQAIRNGEGNYRGDVVSPFTGMPDAEDANAIDNYVSGNGKLILKDFYETDKGITNEERRAAILEIYNNVFMNMVNNTLNSVDRKIMWYPGFECYNYAELAANYFQGWADPASFFEEYWYGDAKEIIDTAYNYNYNGFFNLQCNNANHGTDVGGSHTTIEFPLVGDKTKEENIMRIDAQTGRMINYGHVLLPFGEDVMTEWQGNTESWGPIRGPPIIKKIVYSDGSQEILWENPDYYFYKDNGSGFKEIKDDNHKFLDLDVYNNGYINIATKNPGKAKIEVFSVDGKLLEDRVFDAKYGDNMIDFGFEPKNNGVYIFMLTDTKGNRTYQKIIF